MVLKLKSKPLNKINSRKDTNWTHKTEDWIDKFSVASDSLGSNLCHSYVTLGMLLSLLVAQFPHLLIQKESN